MVDDLVARLRSAYVEASPDEAADAIEKLAHERDVICKAHDRAWDEIAGLEARIAELEAVMTDVTVNLIGAISLLESGGKKAAPSNKMFDQMLVDYKNGVERARAALGEKE